MMVRGAVGHTVRSCLQASQQVSILFTLRSAAAPESRKIVGCPYSSHGQPRQLTYVFYRTR